MKENKKLEIMLKNVTSVHSKRWNTVMMIVELLKNGVGNIIKTVWVDEYYVTEKDLRNITTWSTYDGWGKSDYQSCIDINFSYDENNVMCDAKIFDGDILHGVRQKLRFETKIEFPLSILENIKELIVSEFDEEIEMQYDNHLEYKRSEWIRKKKEEYFN